jgi:hypothetical protein
MDVWPAVSAWQAWCGWVRLQSGIPGTPESDLRFPEQIGVRRMARKYSKSASKDVERAMHKKKRGTLKSGQSGKTVKSRKQAVAIGLSEAKKTS